MPDEKAIKTPRIATDLTQVINHCELTTELERTDGRGILVVGGNETLVRQTRQILSNIQKDYSNVSFLATTPNSELGQNQIFLFGDSNTLLPIVVYFRNQSYVTHDNGLQNEKTIREKIITKLYCGAILKHVKMY